MLLYNWKRPGGGACFTVSKENITDMRWKLSMSQSILHSPSFADDICL